MSKFNFAKKASVSVAALEANTDKGTPETVETVVNTDSEGETQKARAIAFALQEGEEMSAAIELVANAKEDWQGGPIKVLFAMRDTYGEEIDQFPKPDLETGNNPDKFKVPMEVNGVNAIRSTSFYTLFADATKEGKAIIEEIAYLKRLGNVNDKKDGIPSELVDQYLDNEEKRTARANYLNGRRSTIKASYKKAMALYYQMDAVASLPHVDCDFLWITDDKGEDTGEVENTTKPIIVWERVAEGKPVKKREFFSIGSFLKLDANAASEKGGTLKELIKTVARDTTTKAAAFPTIKTAETYIKGLVECFRAMDEFQSDPDQKEMGKFFKVLNSKDAAELKVAVVEYRNWLDDVCDELKLEPWYAELQAKRDPLVTRKRAA